MKTEDYINIIIESTGLTKEEIEWLVADKLNEMESLISEKDALIITARELGVKTMDDDLSPILNEINHLGLDRQITAFLNMIDMSKGKDLFDEKFAELRLRFKKLPLTNQFEFFPAFLEVINGDKQYSILLATFTSLLKKFENLDKDDQFNAYIELIERIKGTKLFKERFTNLLSIIESLPEETQFQFRAFSRLVFAIQGTMLTEKYFVDILNKIEYIEKDYQFLALLNFLSKSEGTNVMNSHKELIKTKFNLFKKGIENSEFELYLSEGFPELIKRLMEL